MQDPKIISDTHMTLLAPGSILNDVYLTTIYQEVATSGLSNLFCLDFEIFGHWQVDCPQLVGTGSIYALVN